MTSHQLAKLLLEQPDMPMASHASNHTAFGDRMALAVIDTYRGRFMTFGNFTLLQVPQYNTPVVEIIYDEPLPPRGTDES